MTDTTTIGKRKHDNAHEPAAGPRQTAKKQKTRHTNEQPAKQPLAGSPHKDGQARGNARKVRFEEPMEEMKPQEIPTISTKDTKTGDEQARKDENLQHFLSDIGMHLEDPDGSSKVVRLPEQGQDRVLTASIQPQTGRPIMHDTPIPRNYAQGRAQSAQPKDQPFLKIGRHGRYGDFDNDPDRRTGRGHQLNPEDQLGLDSYFEYRGQVLQKYPRYPGVDAGLQVHPEVKKSWDENQVWHNGFVERYPGYAVAHLWPCGCEKLRGESENGESEEE